MKEKLVSIVIPVYKVEKYLDRCVQSVVEQSYQNLEIILVDDGSPDNCPAMCDEWAKKDKRIKVIHKQNDGVAMARNDGIKVATGEYIAFVDSDDFVLDNFSKFLSYSTSQNCDIVISNFLGQSKFLDNCKHSQINEKELKTLFLKNIPISCWGKLFLTEFLRKNNLFINKEIYGEDFEWSIRTYCNMKSLAVWNDDFYHYEFTDSSVSNRRKYKHFSSLIENCKNIFKTIEGLSVDKKTKRKLKSVLIGNLYYNIATISKYEKEDKEKVFKLIKSNKQLLVFPSQFKYKIVYLFIKLFGIKMTSKFLSILNKK